MPSAPTARLPGRQPPSEALRAQLARRAGNGCRRPARSRISRAVSRGGRSPRTLTRPGMRRIHLRWYAAYCRVRSAIASIASASGSSAASRSPMHLRGGRRERAGRAPRGPPRRAPAPEHLACSRLDAARELVPRDVEPDDQRRMARFERPQAIVAGPQRRAGCGELERPDDSTAVVGVHTRGRRRIALGEDGVRRVGAEPVVDAAPVLAGSRAPGPAARRGLRARRGSTARCRRRRPASGRRARISSTAACASAAYSPTDASWSSSQMPTRCVGLRRLVREDRQAPVDLHRVRGDDLGRHRARRSLPRRRSCPTPSGRRARGRAARQAATSASWRAAKRRRRRLDDLHRHELAGLAPARRSSPSCCGAFVPRRSAASVRLGPSTSTSSTRPTRAAFRSRGERAGRARRAARSARA